VIVRVWWQACCSTNCIIWQKVRVDQIKSKTDTASDPACMERSHTTLTNPVGVLIAFPPTSSPFHSNHYAPSTSTSYLFLHHRIFISPFLPLLFRCLQTTCKVAFTTDILVGGMSSILHVFNSVIICTIYYTTTESQQFQNNIYYKNKTNYLTNSMCLHLYHV